MLSKSPLRSTQTLVADGTRLMFSYQVFNFGFFEDTAKLSPVFRHSRVSEALYIG